MEFNNGNENIMRVSDPRNENNMRGSNARNEVYSLHIKCNWKEKEEDKMKGFVSGKGLSEEKAEAYMI